MSGALMAWVALLMVVSVHAADLNTVAVKKVSAPSAPTIWLGEKLNLSATLDHLFADGTCAEFEKAEPWKQYQFGWVQTLQTIIATFVFLFDPQRRLPLITVSFRNAENHPIQGVPPKRNWKKFQGTCIQESEQIDASSRSSDFKHPAGGPTYQRGHLTPLNPYLSSTGLMDSTCLSVNVAPQVGKINGGAWQCIERAVHEKSRTYPGYVMTGVCTTDAGVTKTGFSVPACFWTLFCYKDALGVLRVDAYLASNVYPVTDEQCADARRLKSQDTIKFDSGAGEEISRMWNTQDVASILLEGRHGPFPTFDPRLCDEVWQITPQWVMETESCPLCTNVVDETLLEHSNGNDVTYTVTRLITEKLGRNDYRMLYRVAYALTSFGLEHCFNHDRYYAGGIWCVEYWEYCETLIYPGMSEEHEKIQRAFGITWTETSWEDLRKPLYSGLAAYMFTLSRGTRWEFPPTGEGQAYLWNRIYGRDKEEYLRKLGELAEMNKCRSKFDMVMAMDGSGSISDDDYSKQKKAVADMFKAYDLARVRQGLIVFSTNTETQFDVVDDLTPAAIQAKVMASPHPKGMTYTNLALRSAVNMLRTHQARAVTPAVLVVLTDGHSSDKEATRREAVAALNAGIICFAVGVGGYDIEELHSIAGTSTHVFAIDNFEALKDLGDWLGAATCAIPMDTVLNGSLSDTVGKLEKRYYQVELPFQGITIEIHDGGQGTGATVGFFSYTFDNPSAAMNDGRIYKGLTHIRYSAEPGNGNGLVRSAKPYTLNRIVYVTVEGLQDNNEYIIDFLDGKIEGCGLIGTPSTSFSIGEVSSDALPGQFLWEHDVYFLENRNKPPVSLRFDPDYVAVEFNDKIQFYTGPKFNEYEEMVGAPVYEFEIDFSCAKQETKTYKFQLNVLLQN